MNKLIVMWSEVLVDFVKTWPDKVNSSGSFRGWEPSDFTDHLYDFRKAVLTEAREKVLERFPHIKHGLNQLFDALIEE